MLDKENIEKLSYFTIDQSYEPLLWIDQDGIIQHVNPAVISLFGFTKEEIKLNANLEEIITTSNNFRKILKSIEQVANTDSTVLILGETGTGKELIARAIPLAESFLDGLT